MNLQILAQHLAIRGEKERCISRLTDSKAGFLKLRILSTSYKKVSVYLLDKFREALFEREIAKNKPRGSCFRPND
jgi:hypothetical protein